MQATIKLFKLYPDRREYRVGVISRLGDRAFSAHDAAGVPHFMYRHDGEGVHELRHENIPTNEGKVLSVDGMIRPKPVRTSYGTIAFDYRLNLSWVSPERAGDHSRLDGSVMDARGYRYFASTRLATEWLFSYLVPIMLKSNDYLKISEVSLKSQQEQQSNMMARLYAAANGDNYGPEYDVPMVTNGPNTWWASLSETERYRIFHEQEVSKSTTHGIKAREFETENNANC